MVLEYIKSIRDIIAAVLLYIIIFLIVLFFYDMELEPLLYAFVMWGVISFVILAVRYVRFRKKYMTLEEMRDKISIALDDLPAAAGILETQYQELLRELFRLNRKHEEMSTVRQEEMLDYYTMWAHQIKTPIAAMQLLLQEQPGEQSQELSDQLFKTEQYVEMALQYLRTESLNADLQIEVVELDEIIRPAVRKYARSFIRKDISLRYEPVEQQVLTDRKWLIFVLEQLLSNALKYTSSGSIAIYMDAVAADEGKQILVIEDTGIGIRPEDVPRVFEKGFTGYNGRLDKKSTGIGLYLCQRILKKLSHQMELESEPGQGTKVRLQLDSAERLYD